MNDIHVLVVNLNNLEYTKDCISDLARQFYQEFDLTVVDNASSEAGTSDYMANLRECGINVIRHEQMVPLNRIWNDFYKSTENPFLCFLNNDVRIFCNFLSDAKEIFKREKEVGIVGHASNNEKYTAIRELDYVVLDRNMRQGWDYTIRREAFTLIPEQLEVFYGDDFLYAKLYENGWKGAMILSSPMIHYCGMSQKDVISGQFNKDGAEFLKLGLPEFPWSNYSKSKPFQVTYQMMTPQFRPLLTINMVTYERYEETEQAIRLWLNQTDPRFVLDIWQDGADSKKREIVEKFKDNRICYSENVERQNKYGHDMRNKSIAYCRTPFWCTTNDDNLPSPFMVERILANIGGYDILRYSVAMANLPLNIYADPFPLISAGQYETDKYKNMVVLDPNTDEVGRVDACGFVVKIGKIRKTGWNHMEFHGDWLVYEELIKDKPSIKRLPEVLQVHK